MISLSAHCCEEIGIYGLHQMLINVMYYRSQHMFACLAGLQANRLERMERIQSFGAVDWSDLQHHAAHQAIVGARAHSTDKCWLY